MSSDIIRQGPGRAALLGCGLVALLAGCATAPPPRPYYDSRILARAEPPPPPAIYPAQGQSSQQLRRDRYECYRWAADRSGFDPARSQVRMPTPPPQVVPDPPPGAGTAAGVLAGAVIGAAVSNPHHSGEGAAVGAVLGGLVGAASDSARIAEAQAVEQQMADQAARAPQFDARGSGYQRAFAACLEGRGYRVAGN